MNPQEESESEFALVVLVPQAEALVARFRKAYDPSASDAMPAHVTINYPFTGGVARDPAGIRELEELFAGFPSFSFSLREIRRFPNVLYLAPEPDGPFVDLAQAVEERYPESPPYGGEFDVVIPHLSVADVADANQLDSIEVEISEASKGILPIEAFAREIWLMEKRDGRWERVASMDLAPSGVE